MKNDEQANALASAVFDMWRTTDKETELEVHGWSMRPLIDYGDVVVVKHTLNGIRPGTIIAFKRGHRIIIHRVLRRLKVGQDTVYVNKGDANPRHDPLIRERAVMGRVISITRKNRKRINPESTYWRLVGYLIVCWGAVASMLPEWSLELRMVKAFKRILARIVCLS